MTLPTQFFEWMRDALGSLPPRESAIRCDDCVMCRAPAEIVGRPPLLFEPSVKCCTYLPELPNFSVGRILRDRSLALADGRESVRERIAAGEAVTPIGLEQTEAFRARYRPDDPSFGREPRLRCPHFGHRTGRCSIWPYRESTCATWNCKHERGAKGRAFWSALRELLKEVERQLAWWCIVQVGLESEPLAALIGVQEGLVRNRPSMDLWGAWANRKEAWYLACCEQTENLQWNQIVEMSGPEVEARLQVCRHAWRRLQDASIPSRLGPGAYSLAGKGDSFVRLAGYSAFDPLDIPDLLAELLPRFDGQPTAQTLDKIARECGLRIGPEVLRPLVDFGILAAVDEPDPPCAVPSR